MALHAVVPQVSAAVVKGSENIYLLLREAFPFLSTIKLSISSLKVFPSLLNPVIQETSPWSNS